ncbi:YitT family protein [Bacillus sp. V59.32b]|uniref:YitT family protein n=1 Tax=Bacillus sp. V59.32b TaxID=1758642 RepID=UPI000E3C6F89|nr:YitT family protein [Bacillus sp. V59.32b]RFU68558.1 YitT family protein [Bacillus sp. V59.32b]
MALLRLRKKRNRSLGAILYWQIITYVYLTIGAIIQGVGMALFLFPNAIPSGGAAGIAIILNHFLPISIGVCLWFANLTSLTLALTYFGYEWMIRTIYSVSVASFTVNWVTMFWYIPEWNIGFDILCGSLFYGVGVGILIRYGSSSGGMVVFALVLAMYKKWSAGKAMFWMNISIFILTAIIIDMRIVLYAVTCQFLSTRIIDFVNTYKIEFSFFQELEWRKK